MYCLPSIAVLIVYLSGVICCWYSMPIASALNIGSPLSKEAFPPPPVTAKLAEIAHLSSLYTPWKEGIKGAEAVPL